MKMWPALILLLFISCSKDPATANDTQLPVVTIVTPVNNEAFTAGQSISITGSVSDNNYIAEIHIHVTNNNTGALLMDVHIYPAAATTTFNQSLTAASGIDYKIQVIAKDKAVNEGRSTVNVSCN